MYRDRGLGGSRQEMASIDRKRINDALDKHLEKSSPSTSKGLNGKDKERLSAPSTSSGKLPPDHREGRAASVAKNKCSDGNQATAQRCSCSWYLWLEQCLWNSNWRVVGRHFMQSGT